MRSKVAKPSWLVRGAMGRKDIWPSRYLAPTCSRDELSKLTESNNDRDLARTSLLLSPFFQAFDPVQFESYLSNGLTPVDPADPDGAVTLAFPRWAEALVFSESNAMGEVWDRLKFGGKVSNACEDVRWVLPGKGEV